jgi:hypothetical protein
MMLHTESLMVSISLFCRTTQFKKSATFLQIMLFPASSNQFAQKNSGAA